MIDIGHFIQRLTDPFNTESRFYWPLVAGVFIAMILHTAWYLWKPNRPRNPVRDSVESVAYWIDFVVLILFLVFLSAKVRAYVLVVLLVIEWLSLAYVYFIYAPPRFEAFSREERRQRYIPEPRRRAARR
ncbi:MAG: hypothetical protein E6I87_05915 [Chloroflexi bacterium]|nr:MAG: hypothetical protein E6I87_05915 [Chloroflexota bacterium]